MNTISTLSKFFTRKKNQLKLNEIESILDLIPQAVLLIDVDKEAVVLANTNAALLFALNRSELIDQKLNELFPSTKDGKEHVLEWDLASLKDTFSLVIKTQNGFQHIRATPTILDPEMRWLLLRLEPTIELERRTEINQLNDRNWEYIVELAKTLQQPDLTSALNQACQSVRELIGAQTVAIYQLNGSKPSLNKFCADGDSSWLPEQLQASEIMQNQDLQVWRKGRRPGTALHQKARASGFDFLISLPLGQPGAWSGLAIAAQNKPPSDYVDDLLPVVQTILSTSLQIHTLIQSQREMLLETSRQTHIAAFIKNSISDSLILLDQDLRILDMNQSAITVLGYTLSEVNKQPVANILIGGSKIDMLLELTRHKSPPSDSEQARLYRRSGNSFLANLRIMPLKDAETALGFLVLIQDLSELEEYRKRNEQLEQQALLGEVTASFAHETKNPINSLSTGIQLLRESISQDDPLQENVRRLQLSCDRLATVINSGLSFIRPIEYKMQPIRLDKLVHRLLNTTWQQRMHKHQVHSEYHSEANLPLIEGDERALEHLLTNLFDNAVDAMSMNPPETPRVVGITIQAVRTVNDKSALELRISDTGPGITDNTRERIFEPFYTTKTTGTGVGLAIVKRITTAHRGVIQVNSFAGGTIFSLQFPSLNPRSIRIEETIE